MSLFFLGNCQANALRGLVNDTTKTRSAFASITEYWGVYDESAIDHALDAADTVVAQAIGNSDHRYSAAKLRQRFGDRLLLVPYIYLDGIASLKLISSKGRATLRGLDELKAHPAWPNQPKLHRAYANGQIDMNLAARLERSFRTISEVEAQFCDIKIHDFLLENYREYPVLYAINHPTQIVLAEMLKQLCDKLDLSPSPGSLDDPLIWAKRALPRAQRSVSINDANELGLKYEPDSHWFSEAGKLIGWAIKKAS